MNTERPGSTASYKRRGPELHTSLLVVYHSLGVYVHHRQAWKNTTPGRQSPAFKADGYSMFTLIPCGGVGRCLCAYAARLCPVAILRITDERLCSNGRTTSGGNAGTWRKTCPSATLSNMNSTWIWTILRVWLGPSDERPEIHRMSYGAAYLWRISAIVYRTAREITDLLPRAALFNSS